MRSQIRFSAVMSSNYCILCKQHKQLGFHNKRPFTTSCPFSKGHLHSCPECVLPFAPPHTCDGPPPNTERTLTQKSFFSGVHHNWVRLRLKNSTFIWLSQRLDSSAGTEYSKKEWKITRLLQRAMLISSKYVALVRCQGQLINSQRTCLWLTAYER